jgi:hypothetical protein
MCAETVQAQAVICRFCGYNFGTGQMPNTSGGSVTRQANAPFNGLAIASLILGLVGMVLWLFFGAWLDSLLDHDMTPEAWITWGIVSLAAPIVAIVFGVQSRRAIQGSSGSQRGSGLAISGIVLGILATVFVALMLTIRLIDGF